MLSACVANRRAPCPSNHRTKVPVGPWPFVFLKRVTIILCFITENRRPSYANHHEIDCELSKKINAPSFYFICVSGVIRLTIRSLKLRSPKRPKSEENMAIAGRMSLISLFLCSRFAHCEIFYFIMAMFLIWFVHSRRRHLNFPPQIFFERFLHECPIYGWAIRSFSEGYYQVTCYKALIHDHQLFITL